MTSTEPLLDAKAERTDSGGARRCWRYLPPPTPARPRILLVATVLASVGAMALVGGMLAVYSHLREAAGGTTAAWLPNDVIIPLIATNIMLVTMVFASFTMQWAYWAICRNDRRHTYIALALTPSSAWPS